MTESSGGQVDAKLRAALELLCGAIISAKDPVARGEGEAAELEKQLLGRLSAASAQLAQIEVEIQRLQGTAGGLRQAGHRGRDGGAQ